MLKYKHKYGQYFTTNQELKEKIYEFILNKPSEILEPSIGRGDLVTHITNKLKNIKFDMYEIDEKIELLDNINRDKIIYGDFLDQVINKKYTTIIGNPPYIKREGRRVNNLYIEFTKKCYDLLEDNGELIFIVPNDFLKLTSSSKLLNIMMMNGTFTHIYHPNNEKLFENASIDVIIFRYCKNNLLEKKVMYNDQVYYIINNDGLITFNNTENINYVSIKDYFDVYVGLVSGKEEIYKNKELGNIEVINSKNNTDKYIYIDKYPSDNKQIDEYLYNYKEDLIKRKIRKFNDKNWFEWGAPRNIKIIKENLGKNCIYMHNLTRKKNIAFVGKVNYFGGGLIMLIPKSDNYNLLEITDYLNSEIFKDNFMYAGRFKIGHRSVCNSSIPDSYFQKK
jgi:adenine-specific DNA-methyltransferase